MRYVTRLLLAGAAPGALLAALPATAAAADNSKNKAQETPAASQETPAPTAQAAPPAAPAEQAAPQDDLGVGEIVVTAQRREERLQDVPIAISAFSQSTLTNSGVRSMEDLVAVTPGLIIQRSGAGNTPFIRGVGSNSANGGTESPVTTYIDGVYMPSLYATGTSLLNIERVEVLKGPQGTLFGRNSTGGVVQVITRDPTTADTSAELRLTAGTYKTFEGGGYVNLPLATNLAANFTFFVRNQGDGYGTNIQTGNKTNYRNENTFMGKVKYDDGSTSVTLAADFSWFDDPRGFQRVPFPGTTGKGTPGGPPALSPVDFYDVNHGQDAFVRTKAYGGSITINHSFDAFDVTSISAVRQSSSDLWFDNDFGYANLNASRIRFFDNDASQEVRVASNGSGPFSWIFGGFFLSAQGGNRTQIFAPVPTFATYIAGTVNTTSIAGFGELGYQITSRDKLTVGARYTIDHRETSGQLGANLQAPGTLPREKTWRDPTYRIVYDHKFADDIMAYASYNRGFKSGNFNVLPATTPAFNPEYIDAYEVGLKTQFFDKKVRFNVAAYYYDYKDLQVNATTQFSTVTVNAASARIKGVDFDLNLRPIDHLSIDLGGSFLDAKYVDFPNAQSYVANPAPTYGYSVVAGGRDASGRDLLRTPNTTLTGGISYTVPTGIGDFTANARANYTSSFNYEVFHLSYQNAYTLLNLGLGWQSTDGRWNAKIDVTNVTNKEYAISGNVTDTASYYVAGTPRLALFTIGHKF
jgi:iron complex outermembrane receptor protein